MKRKTVCISLSAFTLSLFIILSAFAGETADLASQEQNQGQGTYIIGAGDILEITTWKEEDFSRETVPVRLDGMITFPLIGDIKAEGRTTMQVKAATIRQYLKNIYAKTGVSSQSSLVSWYYRT